MTNGMWLEWKHQTWLSGELMNARRLQRAQREGFVITSGLLSVAHIPREEVVLTDVALP